MTMNGTLVVPAHRTRLDHLGKPPHPHHPHHGHGGRGFSRSWDVPYYIYPEADAASVYQSRNQCVPVAQVNAEIAATLRARGWHDEVMVQADGKTHGMLCPPGVMPMEHAPMMKGLQPSCMVIRDLGRMETPGLGLIPVTIRVNVVDLCGKPFPGVQISASTVNGQAVVDTNADGAAILDLAANFPDEKINVYAYLPEGQASHVFNMIGDSSKPITFQTATPAPKPLVTLTEGLLGSAGIVMTSIGYLADVAILRTFGELGIVAAVFARIGRG